MTTFTGSGEQRFRESATPAKHAPIAGVLLWLATVDHKRIGILYLITSLGFFAAGGLEALLIRIQLAVPENTFLEPDAYNQLMTVHGTTMIFLAFTPVGIGFANYFLPLMIGARDMAFPRLNALSYWLFLFGGLSLYYTFVSGAIPDGGWYAYPPLTEYRFSRSEGIDWFIVALLVSGTGSILGGINLIVTTVSMRAPGMTYGRLPLFVWSILATAIMIVFAFPSLNGALVMLLFDRRLGTHFFDAQTGGDPLFYQHAFWFFGHPEVYIMVLPAFGAMSEVVPVFSRKPAFGYTFIAAASLGIAFLSMAVWAHHMFSTGFPLLTLGFFSATSMLIAVPTGVKIFNWLGTMWAGSIRYTTSMFFAAGMVGLFVIGGISGVTLASVPVDWQVTDTYYVVAHMHYVLFGGTGLGLLAATYYWFPKMSGRYLSERLGKWHFWLTFVGFNLTFFPMHVMGLTGMPRRIFTYPADQGWFGLNFAASTGAAILALSVAVFVWNLWRSARTGEPAGDDPWDGFTLEWATSSPPPAHNFDALPEIQGRRPWWDAKYPDQADWLTANAQGAER